MNTTTDKWIMASITKHFADIASAKGIKFVTEDEDYDPEKLTNWVVLRVVGPTFKELNKGYYEISVEVDLLINMQHNPSNIYNVHEVAGYFEAGCDNIVVYEFIVDDDDIYLFCLPLDRYSRRPIRKLFYGQPDVKTRLKRASVISIYRTETQL
jgi:hypothetical protein